MDRTRRFSFDLDRRRVVGAALVLLATPARAARPAHLLFVCRAGTVKSPFAREIARREAGRRGLAIEARSRGLVIEDHVSPSLAAALAADGLDLGREAPRRLGPADLTWADAVAAFDAPPPPLADPRILDWSDTPSLNERYAEARSVVEARVGALLDAIAAGGLVAPPLR